MQAWTDKVQWRIQLDQTEARRAEKNFLEPAPPPPPISKGLDDRGTPPPPPPPPLSQGLDPTLK